VAQYRQTVVYDVVPPERTFDFLIITSEIRAIFHMGAISSTIEKRPT